MTPPKTKPCNAWTTKFNEATNPEHWRRLVLARCAPDERGCWVWRNALNRAGYGDLHPHRGMRLHAHRASYLAFVGAVAPGMVIDHLCRNRACVNPEHLEAVTTQENLDRGYTRPVAHVYMRNLTRCRNGHEYTEDNVRWVGNASGNIVRNCLTCARVAGRERQRRYRAKRLSLAA